MRHPSHVWADPEFAKEPLDKLVTEYLRHLDGRSQPISPEPSRSTGSRSWR